MLFGESRTKTKESPLTSWCLFFYPWYLTSKQLGLIVNGPLLLYRTREIVIIWQEPTTYSSVQCLSRVRLFVTPWTATLQASLSITNSWRLHRLMAVLLVMPSNHLVLCRPLLLASILPSIKVFSNESVLCIRWPKYWSFSFSISPSSE